MGEEASRAEVEALQGAGLKLDQHAGRDPQLEAAIQQRVVLSELLREKPALFERAFAFALVDYCGGLPLLLPGWSGRCLPGSGDCSVAAGGVGRRGCPMGWPITSPETTISTRRFCFLSRAVVVGGDRVGFPEPQGGDVVALTPWAIRKSRTESARFSERRLVIGLGAGRIGIALDLQMEPGIGEHDAGELGERDLGVRFELIAVGGEEHVAQIGDQPARGIAGRPGWY